MINVLAGPAGSPGDNENERYVREGIAELEKYLGSVAEFGLQLSNANQQALGHYALGEQPPT
jgi:hypothetical protein